MNKQKKRIGIIVLFILVVSLIGALSGPRYQQSNCDTPNGQVAHCPKIDMWGLLFFGDTLALGMFAMVLMMPDPKEEPKN